VVYWLQLAREAAEAKEAASALAEENQALIAKVQRLVPPPDRAGSSASDSRDGSPTKVPAELTYQFCCQTNRLHMSAVLGCWCRCGSSQSQAALANALVSTAKVPCKKTVLQDD
jgi:hypothetical protein